MSIVGNWQHKYLSSDCANMALLSWWGTLSWWGLLGKLSLGEFACFCCMIILLKWCHMPNIIVGKTVCRTWFVCHENTFKPLKYAIMTAADDKFCDSAKIRAKNYFFMWIICLVGQMGRSNTVSTCTARIVFPRFRDETFFTQLSTYRCDCFHDNLAQLGVTYPYTDSKQLSTYFSKLSEMNIFQRRKPKSLHHLGIYSNILLTFIHIGRKQNTT